jgi:drug/metabolite transporter (DMT)-like permease
MGLGYLVVTALAAVVLRERVSASHWLAVLLIATGAACIAGSL